MYTTEMLDMLENLSLPDLMLLFADATNYLEGNKGATIRDLLEYLREKAEE